MNSRHHTLWTLAFLLVLLCGHAVAQTTVVITPPAATNQLSQLTFPSGTSFQDVRVSLASGASTYATVTAPAGVVVRDEAGLIVTATSPNKLLGIPGIWRITVNSAAASTVSDLVISPPGAQQKSLTINVPSASGGGGSGTNTFFASPSSIDFNQTGSTVPSAKTLTLSNPTGSVLSQFLTTVTPTEGSFTNWLDVTNANAMTMPSTSSVNVTITPQSASLAVGVYRARITFTPASGATAIDVPVTLIVNAAGASSLVVSPPSVSFSYPSTATTQQTQTVTVTSAVTTVVNGAITGITFASVSPSSFTASPTPTTLTITIPFPSYVPNGTVGALTLTPTTSSVGTASIPISVNASGGGGGGGFGLLTTNPSTLSFTAAIGGSAPAAQTVQITSSDLFQNPFFTVQTTANWLNVQSNSSATPATLTVGLNMGSLPQSPGTYTGQILLTPYATSGAGFTTAINVTLTVTQTPQVTFTPATPGLTAITGAAGSVQQAVTLTSNIADVPYTTTVTTASGQNWLTVSPATGNLGLTTNLTLGASAASLTAGTYQGQVVVAVQGQTVATIPVTFTVNAAGALQLSTTSLTFNHETTSTSAPAAQTVTIASTGSQLAWNATATAQGGWLQVSPVQGTTPGSLQVSVVPTGLQPGAYNGEVRVTSSGASNSPQTITVRLNVTTPAIPQIVSMVNAASGLPSGAVAGLIVTFRGSDLGPVNGTAWNGQGNVPTTLGGVRVLFDNTPAPILYASATQINAIVPFEVFGRLSTRVQVEYQNQRSRDLELRVNDAGPGLFTLSMTGSGQAAALNQNGTVNGPSNPEDRGRVIQLYGTGGGQTNPAGVTGGISPAALAPLSGRVVVRIGGVEARVTYAGAAPSLVAGAIQINAVIPTEITAGANVSVTVQVGDAPASPGNVTIAVR